MADLEDRIYKVVGTSVEDPEAKLSLKTLGWMNRRIAISKDNTIQLLLRLPTMLHPSLNQLKDRIKEIAEEEVQVWAKEIGIESSPSVNIEAVASKPVSWLVKDEEDQKELESRLGPGLANVAHIIGVYSCKGGVGKSTVAVNLAYELAQMGGRVGLLDLDVYGPSLPVLVKPRDAAVRQSPLGAGMVYPIEHEGVKLLSLGFVSKESGVPGSGQTGASVLRGPMAGKVVTQLIKGTDWGDLDVLVLDLPPGTGDVQLTVCQDLDLSGAVGVTTPSKLALADARKGIEMFANLGIKTMAMVENMAYFDCNGHKHFPFGKGFTEFLAEDNSNMEIDPKDVCQLPISQMANDANDDGVPLSISRPEGAINELEAFGKLSQVVARELFRMPYKAGDTEVMVTFEDGPEKFELTSIQLSLDKGKLMVRAFSEGGALMKAVDPDNLRKRDPKTGSFLVEPEEDDATGGASSPKKDEMISVYKAGSDDSPVPKPVTPDKVERKAKVGYEVTWSDGSKFIYSHKAIVKALGGTIR
ncbi:unnamed protein product [Cylindrotheca closterium]|uniref:Uncharacterized protein n=1 Tax=Cylindrotheca closterium TaxID=2856 RepID=A0AAD2CP82_9STRA|nr:unnamed protein product [Cylindrotheca closterium]